MGNSLCKQCYINDEDDISKYDIKYNSENNLYYTEMNGYDSCEEHYKYRTTPGPPVIIRNKYSYIKALTLI